MSVQTTHDIVLQMEYLQQAFRTVQQPCHNTSYRIIGGQHVLSRLPTATWLKEMVIFFPFYIGKIPSTVYGSCTFPGSAHLSSYPNTVLLNSRSYTHPAPVSAPSFSKGTNKQTKQNKTKTKISPPDPPQTSAPPTSSLAPLSPQTRPPPPP